MNMFNPGDRVIVTEVRSNSTLHKKYVGLTGEVHKENSDYVYVVPDRESVEKIGNAWPALSYQFIKSVFTLEAEAAPELDVWN